MTTQTASRRAATRKLWLGRFTGLLAVAGFFALTWAPVLKEHRLTFAIALCSALVGLSMNVLVGYAGQISLGQGAIFGFGAFMIGNLMTRADVPWVLGLPLSGLATAALALVVGFPALRVRGLNLAILTLSFHFVMERSIMRSSLLSRGASGSPVEPPTIFGVNLDATSDQGPMLLAIMSVFVIIWMLDRNLTRSSTGRAFFAVRQDEQVAASFGVPVARYKLLAFAISGFYAGVAGALFATLNNAAVAEDYPFQVSIEFLVFAVLGGLGSRGGTAAGAAFPVLTRKVLEPLANSGQMLGGILLVGTLIRYPGGLAQQGREIRHAGALFLRRGPQWFLAFIAILSSSVGVGIATPWVINRIVGVVAGEFALSAFWAIVFGILALAVTFQMAARWLARRAFGASASGASATEVAETIAKAEATQALALGVSNGAVPFRRTTVARRRTTGPLLAVDDVAMHFGGVRALDGVTLEVREGELIGIMGPNGSGKTTMLNCISGFLKPTRGDVRFRGASMLALPPHERAARGLGRTFQNIGLVKQETVFDNFLIAQHLVCRYGAMESLLRTGGVTSEERRLRARARSAIELLGLGDIVGEQVRALPHGRAKLVELGCALVSGPEMLLLDEPAAGVSPQEADALGATLKQVASSFGVTILMIEHHVPLMLSTCDYIYVLNFGQLLTHGEPAEVARHPDVIAAYLGSAARETADAPA